MTGLSVLDNPGGWMIAEVFFGSGEEELFELLLEEIPDVLPAWEINPLIKAVIPIGRQVTAGNNSYRLTLCGGHGTSHRRRM